MFYEFFALTCACLAVISLVMALRLVSRGHRVWKWFRLGLGIVLLSFAAALGLVAIDFRTYSTLEKDLPLMTVAFEQVQAQTFIATVKTEHSEEVREFYLRGDQWQVDARILRWTGVARHLGGKPGFRLDRISGRYLDLDQERHFQRTVYALNDMDFGVDFWKLAYQNKGRVPFFEAAYGSAAYVPMADKAEFTILLTASGLVATPANESAQSSLQGWFD